jgi:hypothetical protein
MRFDPFFPFIHYSTIPTFGLGSNIGLGLFVGWVEHPDIFCRVSPPPADQPTCQPFFLLLAKPNKMAEDRTVPQHSNIPIGAKPQLGIKWGEKGSNIHPG